MTDNEMLAASLREYADNNNPATDQHRGRVGMTDDELATFLGIKPDDPLKDKFIASITPLKRAVFERMASLTMEVDLWQDGLGPKPKGVLIDLAKTSTDGG